MHIIGTWGMFMAVYLQKHLFFVTYPTASPRAQLGVRTARMEVMMRPQLESVLYPKEVFLRLHNNISLLILSLFPSNCHSDWNIVDVQYMNVVSRKTESFQS